MKLKTLLCAILISGYGKCQIVDDVLPTRIGVGNHASIVNTLSALIGVSLSSDASPDILRFKSVTSVEYYNGSSWVVWDTDDYKKVLDGNRSNIWLVGAQYEHFRLTVDLGGTWQRPSAFLIGQDWSGGELSYNFSVESSNDLSNWATRLPSTNSGSSYALNIFMTTSETGVDRYVRLTFDTNATSTNNFNLFQISAFSKRVGGLSHYTSNPVFTSYDRNVGIGTTSPTYAKLQIKGGATHELFAVNRPNSDVPALYLGNDGSSNAAIAANNADLTIGKDFDGTYTEYMRVQNNTGNVGIGTTTPDNKLDVKGTIRAEEVKVESTPWPDYVFSNTYQLNPLSEVSTYIRENHHLPGIPTAEEVAENGIKLGEMNAKLLEKVEELTLYLIEEQERNNKLERRLIEIEKLLKKELSE